MNPPELALFTGAAGLVVLLAPLRWSFGVLVGSCLLVPMGLDVPNPFSWLFQVNRVLLVVAVLRLLYLAWRRRLPPHVFRPTPVHTALLLFLVVALVDGIALALPQSSTVGAESLMADLFTTLVFFAVCVAYIRAIRDEWWVLRLVAGLLVVYAGIGLVEHFTGRSYAQWWFSHIHSQAGQEGAGPLELRNGQVRVRASADFALEFAWIVALLLPTVLVVASRGGRRMWLWLVGAGLVVLSLYWSYTRSALLVVPAVGVILVLAARRWRVATIVGSAVLLGFAGVISDPRLAGHYSFAVDPGSIQIRTQRLPALLQAAAGHPVHGIGLTGLSTLGFVTTDSSALLFYAGLGVVGLAAFVLLLVTALVHSCRGLFSPAADLRLPAAAAFTGMLTLIVGGLSFDGFTLLGSAEPFWLLAALGLVSGERAFGRAVMPVARPMTWARMAVGAAAVGFALYALAPVHYAQSYLFRTLPVSDEAAPWDPSYTGSKLVNTTCDTAAVLAADLNGVTVSCTPQLTPTGALGEGTGVLRIQAGTSAQVTSTAGLLNRVVRRRIHLIGFQLDPQTTVQAGRPTLLATAPLWLPVLAVGYLLLFPADAFSSREPSRQGGASRRRQVGGPLPAGAGI